MNRIYHIFFVIFFCATQSYGQICNEGTDSLQKYSYLIFGFKFSGTKEGQYLKLDPVQGTCFFIRSNERLFLVSAKHVFSPWRYKLANTRKLGSMPDTLLIKVLDTSNRIITIPLNIQGLNKDTTTGLSLAQDPDAVVFEIKNKAHYKLNSIEGLIQDPQDYILSDVVLYGYPLTVDIRPLDPDKYLAQESFIIEGNSITDFYSPVKFRNDGKILESFDYFTFQRDNNKIKGGPSGSPVFLRDYNSGRWLFGGVYSSASGANNTAIVVKWTVVQNQVNTYLKR